MRIVHTGSECRSQKHRKENAEREQTAAETYRHFGRRRYFALFRPIFLCAESDVQPTIDNTLHSVAVYRLVVASRYE